MWMFILSAEPILKLIAPHIEGVTFDTFMCCGLNPSMASSNRPIG